MVLVHMSIDITMHTPMTYTYTHTAACKHTHTLSHIQTHMHRLIRCMMHRYAYTLTQISSHHHNIKLCMATCACQVACTMTSTQPSASAVFFFPCGWVGHHLSDEGQTIHYTVRTSGSTCLHHSAPPPPQPCNRTASGLPFNRGE